MYGMSLCPLLLLPLPLLLLLHIFLFPPVLLQEFRAVISPEFRVARV